LYFESLQFGREERLFVILVQYVSIVKTKHKIRITYKLVVNDPINKPGWVFLITGIIKGLLNICHHCSDVNVLLGLEGLDSMMKLLIHFTARKPKRMLCQERNN